MKKLLFILLACFISVSLVSLGIAQTPDEETPALETICDGLTGAAFGLCNAYCEAQDCNLLPAGSLESCEDLRKNYTKKTGKSAFPCDHVLACGICADAAGFGTEGECVNIINSSDPEEECDALAPDGMGWDNYECSEIILPVDSDDYHSCLAPEGNPFVYPLCQNSIPGEGDIFNVCGWIFGGETLPPNSCPALPSCYDE